MTDYTQFNKKLIAQREKLGLSIDEMADRVGVHKATIYRLERGHQAVTVINGVRIARAYCVKIEPLMLFIASIQGYEGE